MASQDNSVKPEVMSPAGHWPQLHAAIEAGADAVYFGLKHFSARAKVGFGLADLPEVMQTLHRRGVKGYVTFNTLVFEHELAQAAQSLAAIVEAGADAIIVQDVGIAQLARQIAPALPLHGSTQMSITSADGVKLAQQWGLSRVILARELSLEEVSLIRAQTDGELEIFVHGALCVSYSGQCFSSEAWGGRSANRGQCAQACRLPYQMVVDGKSKSLGPARYLLSPGDLCTLRHLPQILQTGVNALKIEGRYKDATYVALATHAYRRAVDDAWAGRPLSLSRLEEHQLEQVYSRGSGAHFIHGPNHQAVVTGRSPGHRGLRVGKVARVSADGVVISPNAAVTADYPLKPGDGLVFDAADWRSPEEPEEGGRIYHVIPLKNGQFELQFGNNALNLARIKPGDWVWRTDEPGIEKIARPFTQANAPVYKQPVALTVIAQPGQPLQTGWRLTRRPEIEVAVSSADPLGEAENRVLTADFLRDHLGRLGNTPYQLAELSLEMRGKPFAPSSVLNQVRRQAVDLLAEQQTRLTPAAANPPQNALRALMARRNAAAPAPPPAHPALHLLVRTAEQLSAAITLRPADITLDYLDLYGLQSALEQIHAAGISARVAAPRILKPAEGRIIRFLLKLDCPILVRSAGLLYALQPESHPPLVGDFSLNAANSLTADTFLKMDLLRLTPTHDLNAAQVASLARSVGADKIEAVAYQHLPVFHTEHCVFCRFLSGGTSYKDCGHPCEKHRVLLQDRNGRAHPVLADVGCRNTVFGAQAQSADLHLEAWLNAGIRHFRLEFAHESAEQVSEITRAFGQALSGKLSPAELGRRLQQIAPQGTTEGSLFVPDDYLAMPPMY